MQTDIDRANKILEAFELIDEARKILGDSEFKYSIKNLIAAQKLLFERFAPFKLKDRVVLNKKLDFKNAPGWKGCEHFLVPGAKATVERIYCNEYGNLRFELIFDDESWIGLDGKIHPIIDKHLFVFSEDCLALVDDCKQESSNKEIKIESGKSKAYEIYNDQSLDIATKMNVITDYARQLELKLSKKSIGIL